MVLRCPVTLDFIRDLFSPVSCIQEYLHPRELGLLGIALLLSITMLCLGLYECGDESLEELQRWSNRPWARMECKVLQHGIAYLGDCDARTSTTVRNWHIIPHFNYTSCPTKLPQICHSTLRGAYKYGGWRRLSDSGAGGDDGSAAAAAADAAWRERPEEDANEPRQLKEHMHFAEVCRDSFLAWVHVEVKGVLDEACSYRTGLYRHSQVLKIEQAVTQLDDFSEGQDIPCWLLTLKRVGLASVSSCNIVAFDNPEAWTEGTALERDRAIRKVLLWVAICSASIAALSAAIGKWCCQSGTENWSDFICRNPFVTDQMQEEADSERVRFVRDRWRLFRASVLAEYQPVASARDCISGDR
mmetsp:Transcript_18826/g.47200  ORF Transcript_18826/g.47200 Transcript_18826/m.47200 type:complete len:358 (-) Transcript_18826:94-1167(-)